MSAPSAVLTLFQLGLSRIDWTIGTCSGKTTCPECKHEGWMARNIELCCVILDVSKHATTAPDRRRSLAYIRRTSQGVNVRLLVACWISWKILARFVLKSPLDIVPGPPRSSLLLGNMGQFMHRQAWDFQDELMEKYGPVCKLHDLLGARSLFVYDPKALYSVLLRDQDTYEETQWLLEWNKVVFGSGLLSTQAAHHRKQRKLLNPVFSTNHMKRITPIFYDVAGRLGDAISIQVKNGRQEVDMLNWMSRAALELIGQGGLGYSFDPLIEDTKNEYGDALKRLLPVTFDLIIFQLLSPYYIKIGSPEFRRRIVELIPIPKIQELKSIVDTMDRQSRTLYRSKKEALQKGDEQVSQQIAEEKDILSVMIQANMDSSEEDRLDDEELIAQISTLVLAATDTTSNALSRILHLLAQHQDVQEKLRTEIIQAKDENRISYDRIVDLPYLDAVCRESLRVYPPATFVTRDVLKDAILPLSRPIRATDGSELTEIFVPKDSVIVVSIRGCNINKELWGDDADQWKPERWLSPLSEKISEAHVPGIYANLMTFLGGPRSCIGFKFSQLEMKIILCILLEKFRFHLSDKEVVWNISGVVYPTVGKDSDKPSLPLIVEPIQ